MKNSNALTGYYHGHSFPGYDWHQPLTAEEIRRTIVPLTTRLREMDTIRIGLEQEGGGKKELVALREALSTPIILTGKYGDEQCFLNKPATIKTALSQAGCAACHLEVRRLANNMPAYLVCRLTDNYLTTSPLVLEEFYQSPGFPMPDQRFIRLMRYGHEHLYLNMAPWFGQGDSNDNRQEHRLITIGSQVLLAAWHEDQYTGRLVAEILNLRRFPQAVELLYLLLSGDLAALRHNVDIYMINFFNKLCPQPALAAFLQKLPSQDTARLSQLTRDARDYYKKLAMGFGELLQTRVEWGKRQTTMELYKIIFANFSRPDGLQNKLRRNHILQTATSKLENRAGKIIARLVKP